MAYTLDQLRNELHDKGEIMVDMDNDEVFELHLFNTEFDEETGFVKVKGYRDGEWQERTFDPENVQDTYIHYEF